jgi:hypothetical protein
MRRSELKRATPLKRSGVVGRPGEARDWRWARAKVERERTCRVDDREGACAGRLQAAHVIGRERDPTVSDERGREVREVQPDAIVPLCVAHHRAYDAHEIDLLPYLTLREQLRAVEDAGGIANALRRISGRGTA